MKRYLCALFSILVISFPVFGLHISDSAIEDFFVLSDIDGKEIEVRFWPGEKDASGFDECVVRAMVEFPDGSVNETKALSPERSENGEYFSLKIDIDPVIPWYPDSPKLYNLDLVFETETGEPFAAISQRFGMRKLETGDGKFFVNNHPFYVRACAGEGGCGCDDLSREQLEKRISQMVRYGFNTVRHHSHVPTDEYLDVADEQGVFVQMEIGGKKIGDDIESDTFKEWEQKWNDMVKMARRHPSTFVYSPGNEMYYNHEGLVEVLDSLYDTAKNLDPSTLILNRSGSNPFNDDFGKYDLIERPIGEYEHIPEFAREAFELYLRGDRRGRSDEYPIIAHEYPLIASYPNPALAHKYDDVPEWIETTVENARKNNQEHLLPEYVKYTEKLQALLRKEMFEEARKFPELDGYSMLRFVDCGDYVSGVVDDFADPKNVSIEEFLQCNGETILMCTWPQNSYRSFYFGDEFKATIHISHHGREEFEAPECRWRLMYGPEVIEEGVFEKIRVDPVSVADVGEIIFTVPEFPRASKFSIRVRIPGLSPRIFNQWDFWAFPDQKADDEVQKDVVVWDPRGRLNAYPEYYENMEYITDENWKPGENEDRVMLTDSWMEEFYDFLGDGGRVFMISDKSWAWPEEIGIFGLHITRMNPEEQSPAIFPELDEPLTKWLTVCSNHPKRYGNSGTLIYNHPAIKNFPHDGFCSVQFFPMIYRAKSLWLKYFPEGTVPVIRAIDNYYRVNSKAYMAELGAGEGKIFITTLNITNSFSWSKAARFMFDELLRYVTGDEFQPDVQISTNELKKMHREFAEYLEENPQEQVNELGARYETLWKKRLSPREFIALQSWQAQGADEKRMDVHYEYAQTQWFFNAKPSDQLSWKFENESERDFNFDIFLAGPLKNIPVTLKLDNRDPQKLNFPGTDNWRVFRPLSAEMKNLDPGEHRLTIIIDKNAPEKEGRTVQLRDVEIRAIEE